MVFDSLTCFDPNTNLLINFYRLTNFHNIIKVNTTKSNILHYMNIPSYYKILKINSIKFIQ